MNNATQKHTYCRICEPMCGLVVDVEDGKITKLKSNKEHVLSQGHLCAKAKAASEVSYDKDRVLTPLKKNKKTGEFESIGWPQAYKEIAEKITSIQQQHGKESLATYTGNPTAFAGSIQIWLSAFKKLMGIKWSYGVGCEDTAAPMVAASLAFGSLGHVLKPDLWRTDFVMVMGANPFVAHSSMFTEPLLRHAFTEIKEREGRIVVIDPRCTETARKNEHIGIKAGTDAYLLMAMLHVIIKENLVDTAAIADKAKNYETLVEEVKDFTPELAAGHTGVAAEAIRQLARDFANAKSACVIARTGTSTQRYGTLTNLLIHSLCLVTGNLDTEGGMLFGEGLISLSDMIDKAGGSGAEMRSRTTDQTTTASQLPSAALPSDILEPGEGQVRALMTIAANPVLNSPAGGEKLQKALEDLELFVSMDFYINETNRFADYILPSTTMFEREDMPLFGMDAMLRPAIWATEAVAEAQGEAKPEWKILNELAQALGFGGCYESGLFRGLSKLGWQATPRFFYDLMIRTSTYGDRFGLKPSGLSFKKLVEKYPNGYRLMPHLPSGKFKEKVRTESGLVDLGQAPLLNEIHRLRTDGDDHPEFPLRLISQREMLSQNSWLHNVDTTMKKSREHTAKVHPDDANRYGIADGDMAQIESPWGSVTVKVKHLKDMTPGNVALPHGWGHRGGGWQRANQAGGVNANILASDRAQDAEAISGSSVLNGVPVRFAS